jgi:glycosyltransferase involved in cell wall biosynthesis
MNRGAELAEGQWIAPLDDDDEFTPQSPRRSLEYIQRSAEVCWRASGTRRRQRQRGERGSG